MKDKYYQPRLEEFHPGFEYEAINAEDRIVSDFNYHDNLKEWTNYTFTGKSRGFEGATEIAAIESKEVEVRVKYLNEEGILSLGWKKEKHNDLSYSIINNNYSREWVLVNYYEHYTLFVRDISPRALIDEEGKNKRYDSRFEGSIKNKSELKQVMVMVMDQSRYNEIFRIHKDKYDQFK